MTGRPTLPVRSRLRPDVPDVRPEVGYDRTMSGPKPTFFDKREQLNVDAAAFAKFSEWSKCNVFAGYQIDRNRRVFGIFFCQNLPLSAIIFVKNENPAPQRIWGICCLNVLALLKRFDKHFGGPFVSFVVHWFFGVRGFQFDKHYGGERYWISAISILLVWCFYRNTLGARVSELKMLIPYK